MISHPNSVGVGEPLNGGTSSDVSTATGHAAPATTSTTTSTPISAPTSALLSVRDLCVNYGGIQALQGISFDVHEGEVVSLIGANGAGKSTTLRAISRIVKARSGSITYAGNDLLAMRPEQVVRAGIAHSPEGRRVLTRLSVEDNLELGAYVRSDTAAIKMDLEEQFTLFPRLRERRSQLSGTLSGGEQQMLAIARALMSRPKLLLLDEPSLGLAPIIVLEIFSIIDDLREKGVTVLLIEQNANFALTHSDRAYVLETGRVLLQGPAAELREDERVREAYLG
jgi:branched-chain amino acid transport system ATP-binding protein